MAIKGILSDSLCWKCARSTDSSCSWADSFTPVDGWDAEPTERYSEVYKTSYKVNHCPLFKEHIQHDDIDDTGAQKLCGAIMARAGQEYKRLLQSHHREDVIGDIAALEHFFKSELAELYGEDVDPVYLMESIRRIVDGQQQRKRKKV